MNFGMRHRLLMNTAMGGDTGGGGAGDAGGAGDGGQGAAGGAGGDGGGVQMPEWAKDIEPDLMNDPIMKNHKDIKSVVKSYVHAARMVGADKVVVPGKNATPEEIKNYISKLGLPESADKYTVNLDKDSLFGGEKLAKVKELALQHNILPSQLESLLKFVESDINGLVETETKKSQEEMLQGINKLKQEWGEEGFKKNAHMGHAAAKHFGGDEFVKYLNDTGLGNDPMLIKIFSQIGNKLKSEDTFNADVVGRFAMTKDEAQRNIAALFADKAYLDASHPQHAEKAKDMLKFQAVLSGN